MTLVEHLRELRHRLTISFAAIGLGMLVGWAYYSRIFELLDRPFRTAREQIVANGGTVPTLALTGVADAFTLQVKVAAMTGLVLASPIWIYQLWRFITPGLHRNERRWALLVVATAVPLFLTGMAVAYMLLPKGLGLLLGFTPASVNNIIAVDRYISFFIRMMLVFGLGFLTPVFIVLLNAVGILSADRLRSWWRYVILGVLVFAAVATPTGDPINMSLLAAPMLALIIVAFGICWLNDRRRARRMMADGLAGLSDDEASPLDVPLDQADDQPTAPGDLSARGPDGRNTD